RSLSDEDANSFLESVPIVEPEIRATIIRSAKGLPFYLDLQTTIYEQLRNRHDAVSSNQFGQNHPEILARFLDHLDPDDARLLRITAHARFLNNAVFAHLCVEFFRKEDAIRFSEL